MKRSERCGGFKTVDDNLCVVIEPEEAFGVESRPTKKPRPSKSPSPTVSASPTTSPSPSPSPSPSLTTVCTDDGVSGKRVQAVYAVSSDKVNRAETVVPLIKSTYAPKTNAVFYNSGGVNVRWVHDATCTVDVIVAILSPAGDDSFSATKTELRSLGLTDTSRKYLVWLDATVSGSCGIANVSGDSTPELTNRNNSGPTFGRVDNRCWGNTSSVEAHELAHTL
jgi:hypothetical protein